MQRRLRIEFEGAICHAMAQGNARQKIIRDDADRRGLTDGVDRAIIRYGWELLCYVIMRIHLHLLLNAFVLNLHTQGVQHFLSPAERSGRRTRSPIAGAHGVPCGCHEAGDPGRSRRRRTIDFRGKSVWLRRSPGPAQRMPSRSDKTFFDAAIYDAALVDPVPSGWWVAQHKQYSAARENLPEIKCFRAFINKELAIAAKMIKIASLFTHDPPRPMVDGVRHSVRGLMHGSAGWRRHERDLAGKVAR